MEATMNTGLGRYLTCLPLFWLCGNFPEGLQELFEEEWKQRTAEELPFKMYRPENTQESENVKQILKKAIENFAEWKEELKLETRHDLTKFQIAFLFFAQPDQGESVEEQLSAIREVLGHYEYELQIYAFYDFTAAQEEKKKTMEILEKLRQEASVAVFTQELLKPGKEAYRKAVHAICMNCFLNCVEDNAGKVVDVEGRESFVQEKGTLYTAGCHTLDLREQIQTTEETEPIERYKERVKKAVEETAGFFCKEKIKGFAVAPVCWQAVEEILPKGLFKSGVSLKISELLEYFYGTMQPLTQFLEENMPPLQEVLPKFWEKEKGSTLLREQYLGEYLKELLEEVRREKQSLKKEESAGQTIWLKKGIQPEELLDMSVLDSYFIWEEQNYLLERRETLLQNLQNLLEQGIFEDVSDVGKEAAQKQEELLLEKLSELMVQKDRAISVLDGFGKSLSEKKIFAETTQYYGAKLNAVSLTIHDGKTEVFYIKPWDKMPLTVERLGERMKSYLPGCKVESRAWQKEYCVELFVLRKLTDMSAVGD